MDAPNISMSIFILFVKPYHKVISLYFTALPTTWLQTLLPSRSPVSSSRDSANFSEFFEAVSFSRGSVVVVCFILFYFDTGLSSLSEHLHWGSPLFIHFVFIIMGYAHVSIINSFYLFSFLYVKIAYSYLSTSVFVLPLRCKSLSYLFQYLYSFVVVSLVYFITQVLLLNQ